MILPDYLLSFLRAVEHPLDAEFVGEAAEVVAPEHVLQFHVYFTAGFKGVEEAFGFFAGGGHDADVDVVAKGNFHAHGLRGIGTLEEMAAGYGEADVHDQVFVFLGERGHTGLRWHVAIAHDGSLEFGFKDGLIEVEGFFGIVGEVEVCAYGGHG